MKKQLRTEVLIRSVKLAFSTLKSNIKPQEQAHHGVGETTRLPHVRKQESSDRVAAQTGVSVFYLQVNEPNGRPGYLCRVLRSKVIIIAYCPTEQFH